MFEESGFFNAPTNDVGLAWFFGGFWNRQVYRGKIGILVIAFFWLIATVETMAYMKELN